MDQSALVEDEIVDGRRFLERFVADGNSVAAAAWIKADEEASWLLHVATELYDREETLVAYRTFDASLSQLDDPVISNSQIRLIGVKDPIARSLAQLAGRHPKRSGFPVRYARLGSMMADQVYVYSAWVYQSIRPGSMTVEDLGQAILRRLMRGSGLDSAAQVTLKDGTSFSGVPLILYHGDRDTMRVQFDAGQETPRIYPISAIDSIR